MTEARVERFVERMRERFEFEVRVREMDDATHTAADAAAALGVPVGAIVKSLLLIAGGAPVLALVSGANRVDLGRAAAALGAEVRLADAKTVKAVTGSSIGGVPPLAHPEPLRTVVDRDLLGYPELWAAAASSRANFPISPDELLRLSAGTIVEVA